MKTLHFDLIVLGSGFGGSLLSMVARQLGRSVLLLERGAHPRFAIGESSTPLANSLWEELSERYDLPRLRPLSKWGSWQQAYPEIGCGLKRGFSFFHHSAGQAFQSDAKRSNQLLVAASSRDEAADTHWYRPDFDHFLVREAQRLGVEYLDHCALQKVTFGPDSVSLEAVRHGRTIAARAKFVVDATGPRGALHRALALPEKGFPFLPPTQALFSHFRQVQRLESLGVPAGQPAPPYPIDDAALHHVFEGGWIWVLRFNNGLTSAGVAATDQLSSELQLNQGAPAWERLLQRYPTVGAHFEGATAELPFVQVPRLSFQSGQVVGPNWALLPSAAGFIDPLLSTGFTLTLLGLHRLARAMDEHWGKAQFARQLEQYGCATSRELLAVERVVAALYSSMDDFSRFVPIALLYFASVSFAEIARRVGKPQLATSFLLQDRADFGPKARACCEDLLRSRQRGARPMDPEQLQHQVLNAIAPIDLIGLSDLERHHWYPVRSEDLRHAAGKLGLSLADLDRL